MNVLEPNQKFKYYECIYNFITINNCNWSFLLFVPQSVLFTMNWKEKTIKQKILMFTFYSILVYIINIFFWVFK